MSTNIPSAIDAKHASGERILRDLFPIVRPRCSSIDVLDREGYKTIWPNFRMRHETGLELWSSFDEGQPSRSFRADTKIKVKDDHIELESGEKIYFNELIPINIF